MAIGFLMMTDYQREIQAKAREIMERMLPLEELHRREELNGGVGEFPKDVQLEFMKADLFAINMTPEYGGKGKGFVDRTALYEAISYTDPGFAFGFRGLGDKFDAIANSHLPEEEKHKWAAKFLETKNPEVVGGSFCLTEPQAGSDATRIETTAVYDKGNDEWIINGEKCFINNSDICSYMTVFAWTDKTVSAGKGVTAFLVEKDREGVEVLPAYKKMGLKLENVGGFKFNNVRVPSTHIVGELGGGFRSAMGKLDVDRAENVSFCLGAAQSAVDFCKKFANTRQAFGKYIVQHEGVGFQIAEMEMKLQTARALLFQAMEAGDRGMNLGTALSIGTKWYGIQMCVEVAQDCIDILGGRGTLTDYPLEKVYRDLRAFPAMGGTPLIAKRTIAKTFTEKH